MTEILIKLQNQEVSVTFWCEYSLIKISLILDVVYWRNVPFSPSIFFWHNVIQIKLYQYIQCDQNKINALNDSKWWTFWVEFQRELKIEQEERIVIIRIITIYIIQKWICNIIRDRIVIKRLSSISYVILMMEMAQLSKYRSSPSPLSQLSIQSVDVIYIPNP